jgi:hypothetical protein
MIFSNTTVFLKNFKNTILPNSQNSGVNKTNACRDVNAHRSGSNRTQVGRPAFVTD